MRLLRKRLIAISGEAAALAGWLAFECGNTVSAHFYWDKRRLHGL